MRTTTEMLDGFMPEEIYRRFPGSELNLAVLNEWVGFDRDAGFSPWTVLIVCDRLVVESIVDSRDRFIHCDNGFERT